MFTYLTSIKAVVSHSWYSWYSSKMVRFRGYSDTPVDPDPACLQPFIGPCHNSHLLPACQWTFIVYTQYTKHCYLVTWTYIEPGPTT